MKNITLVYFFLLVPFFVDAKVMVINGLTHTFKSNAGEVVTGYIKLKNVGNKVDKISIYKNDLITACNSSSIFVEPNSHSRSIAAWLSTNVDEKILIPNEEYEVLYTIAIPKDSTLKGSYWGVLMIEVGNPISEKKEGTITLMNKARYAIQIIGEVGDEEMPELTFEDFNISSENDSVKIVKIQVSNLGNVQVRSQIIVELLDDSGQKLATFESEKRRIFPSKCSEFQLKINGIKKGKYTGVIMADYGGDIYAKNIEVEI